MLIVNNKMSFTCRSCLIKGQKDYVSLLAIFPEFEKRTILDLLRAVTSSEIPYTESLPSKLCANCFKKLNIAYSFIVLFKNSQALLQKCTPDKDSKIDNPVIQDSIVIKKENMEYIVDSDGSERIVIVNEDDCAYEDIVQEIFGSEEPKEKTENIQRQVKQSQSNKYSNIYKNHSKIILVSVDDIRKEPKPKLPHPEKNLEYRNIFHQDQDEVFFKQEEEVLFNKKDEVFLNKGGEIDDEDIFSEAKEDDTHSIGDSVGDLDVNKKLSKMEENRDRNISNIQIVTIEDVLNSSRRKGDKNKIMSVEDLKPRANINRIEEVLNSTRKEDVNRKFLSVEDVLKIKPRTIKNEADNGSETFLCDICYTSFDKYRKLRLHKSRVHHPNWQEIYKCQICGLQSKTKSAHCHHLTKHTNKRYPCDQCEKTYMSRSKMREHVLRVHEKKHDNRYLCPDCGKGFKFSNALQYHMNKHTNSRNFVCRYCGFACLALSAVKRHERVHTGERPYQCKHCNKTFAGAPEKQMHEFGHEGVFRYQCKYCNKKFIQTYNMKVHWMQHKGPYGCEICNRAFADTEILKFHYAHTHKIKDVIIENVEVQSEEELITDEVLDNNAVLVE